MPGTTTGTRLRPEDEVTTDAQFAGQQAMIERRKLIDELVSTGVPAVSAADSGRTRAPLLALLYLLIPVIAIIYLVNQGESTSSAAPPPVHTESAPAGPSDQLSLHAEGLAFDLSELVVPADKPFAVTVENHDTTVHNFSVYEAEPATPENQLFKGKDVPAGGTVEEDVDALPKGSYYFQCDYHPAMNGTIAAE